MSLRACESLGAARGSPHPRRAPWRGLSSHRSRKILRARPRTRTGPTRAATPRDRPLPARHRARCQCGGGPWLGCRGHSRVCAPALSLSSTASPPLAQPGKLRRQPQASSPRRSSESGPRRTGGTSRTNGHTVRPGRRSQWQCGGVWRACGRPAR